MLKNPSPPSNQISPNLLALTPRQVLLRKPTMKQQVTSNGVEKAPSLKPDQMVRLLKSVGAFLEHNGFSKSLKKFLKEAKIEKDGLKDASVNLEEMYYKYLEACNFATKNLSNQTEIGGQTDNNSESDEDATETLSKKDKKKSGQSDTKNIKEVATEAAAKSNVKSKEKKKSKKTSDSGFETVNLPGLDSGKSKNADDEKVEGSIKKKSKESKKRKREASEENDTKPIKETTVEEVKHTEAEDTEKTKGGDTKHAEGSSKKKNKVSKKQKRDVSNENDTKPVDGSKDTKSEDLKKSEGEKFGQELYSKTPIKEVNGQENDNVGEGQKSASQKSGKKQCETSTEPKTVKAFSRVKIEEVKFVDERLQDNSYWAKDGAESGYGAKAQEVLGQVRGRDFRHEKTKKKRGSYRGGQIDLQSHSIKFNDSDEE